MHSTRPVWYIIYRTYKSTGPFIVMMYLMIHTDIVRVAIIFCIFLSGFAIGTHTHQTNPWVFKAKKDKKVKSQVMKW